MKVHYRPEPSGAFLALVLPTFYANCGTWSNHTPLRLSSTWADVTCLRCLRDEHCQQKGREA